MPEQTSQIVINEPSADVKPYLELLRNAAFGLVFTPQAIRNSQLPGAANLWGNITAPTTNTVQTPTSLPSTTQAPIDVPYSVIDRDSSSGSRLAQSAAALERAFMDAVGRPASGTGRFADGGRLSQSASDIERGIAQFLSDVNLGAGGSPIGGMYPALPVSPPARVPVRIGTGTQAPPPPTPPSVTPPPTSVGGVITTPPSGPPLVVTNPNPVMQPPPQPPPQPQPQRQPQPGFGGAAAANQNARDMMFSRNQPENFAGAAAAQAAGYNPNQYADRSVADQLAARLGGGLTFTNTGGPIGPPSQATLDFGGGAQLNTGLVQDRIRRGEIDAIREEIRNLGGTVNFAKGGTVRAQQGLFAPTNNPFKSQRDNQFSPTRLSSLGAPTAPPNPWGASPEALVQATAQPLTTPNTEGLPPGTNTSFSVLNPYQRYEQQRVLGMGGDFGQVGANNQIQVSNLTRAGLGGLGRLPSYFNEYGDIQAGRAPNGQATTNFGIANDVFDVAGNQALSAAQNADTLFGRNDITSTFQDTMRYLQQNPTQFQAGDITLGQLEAPQLNAPTGISPSQLTSYQMAGPRLVDTSVSNINPLAVQGESITGLPQLTNFQMTGPRLVDTSASNINPLSVQGESITGLPQLTNFQMTGPERIGTSDLSINPMAVTGQRIRDINATNAGMQVQGEGYQASTMSGPSRFIDATNAQSYMSPYQRAVIDTQLQEAQRGFEEDRASRNARAIQAGAFGGSRQAVAESAATRDLANQRNAIVASGTQSAFENAQQQFERDRAAQMQAQSRNQEAVNQASQFSAANRQGAGLANQANAQAFGLANLQALLQTQELGAQLGQQANLANQQAMIEAGRANQGVTLQARLANQQAQQQANERNLAAALGVQELGAGQQFNAAQLRAQFGQQANLANQQAALEAGRANQATNLQSQLANQQALQQANERNLAASLGVQELGAGQQFNAQQLRAQFGQQANLANQQAFLDAARSNQGVNLQSQLANQQALQQANERNLAAALGVQELGAQQQLASQQANQQAGLTAGQSNLQAALATQQLGRTSGLSAAQANQQTRLAQNQALLDAMARADQLQQQAAQGNVGNRLAALGQQTQSALAANQIGQSRADLQRLAQAMELQNLQALQAAGAGVDARTQQALDLGYQDFINQRNFPYQQLNWLTGLVNNMPQSFNQEQVLFNRTNPLSQIAGLATAGLGAFNASRQG
jgi:hypothetical protein